MRSVLEAATHFALTVYLFLSTFHVCVCVRARYHSVQNFMSACLLI